MAYDREELIGGQFRVSKKIKYTLLVFSMFFWLVGGLFMAVGGYSISQKQGYEELSDFATDPGVILAVLGCFIFFVSTFGVLGSLRENLCLLKTYKIFLMVIFCFEVFCGIIAFAFWPEVKKMVDYNLQHAIKKYTVNSDLRNMIDKFQREIGCCGSLTIDDWDSNPYFSCENLESYRSCGVPWSCCLRKFQNNRQCGYGVRNERVHLKLSNEIYQIGCLDAGFQFFKSHLLLTAGLAIGFTLPLFIGIFLSHMLGRQLLRFKPQKQ
ncbi:tetraspanin-33 [Hydra vulgaris]|uniref:tetraspanin-33 n=1 Tax=Hydra vulgaris TaxID=6087 RepID=UPI0001923A32|nr:tetraspanin-33-like isoform X2 [Hydra vulgaris]